MRAGQFAYSCHQRGIAGAAAAYDYLIAFGAGDTDRIRDGAGGELKKRGLYIARLGRSTRQTSCQPIDIEQLPTGAFRGLELEERVGQKPNQQRWINLPTLRPLAVFVEWHAEMGGCPMVHQNIAGPAVEPRDCRPRGENSQIADAANVHNCAKFDLVPEYAVVKRWRQWRSLTTGSHVTTAKVSNDGDPRELCQQGCILQLNAEPAIRSMPDRLAVAANALDVLIANIRAGKNLSYDVGIDACQLD